MTTNVPHVSIGEEYADRHEATRHLLRTLTPNPNLSGTSREVAEMTWELATGLVALLGDGPELSSGLRKLREAKDCFVLQYIMCDNLEVE